MKSAAFAVLFAALSMSGFAETVKDREAAVRNDRAAMEKDARWIYNDTERGFAEAKRTSTANMPPRKMRAFKKTT